MGIFFEGKKRTNIYLEMPGQYVLETLTNQFPFFKNSVNESSNKWSKQWILLKTIGSRIRISKAIQNLYAKNDLNTERLVQSIESNLPCLKWGWQSFLSSFG